MLQCQQHLFRAFCVMANSWWPESTSIFFAQMASFVERYYVIYHPFPINSQYLRTWGVDSPEIGIERAMACVAVRIQIFRSRWKQTYKIPRERGANYFSGSVLECRIFLRILQLFSWKVKPMTFIDKPFEPWTHTFTCKKMQLTKGTFFAKYIKNPRKTYEDVDSLALRLRKQARHWLWSWGARICSKRPAARAVSFYWERIVPRVTDQAIWGS